MSGDRERETLFLIEVRINDDESMAPHVFQYGFACAVETRQPAKNVTTLTMPAARIIYWEPLKTRTFG
jgi:hypothetical protein